MSEKLRLVQTCGACPEQYDVFRGEEKVGSLRLRHGHFRAECHSVTVYESSPRGDGLFEEDEREFYLNAACFAILERLTSRTTSRLYEIERPTGFPFDGEGEKQGDSH